MAPYSDEEDDFVRTILDTDTAYPVPDKDSDLDLSPPTKTLRESRKRKRDNVDFHDIPNGSSVNHSKKSKKNNTHSRTAPINHSDITPEEENETWTAHGEVDGAMDSDFEFQIGDVDVGITEDFDGWGVNGDTLKSTAPARGNTKGVDIDELIARRRKNTNGQGQVNGDESKVGNEIEKDDRDDDTQDESEAEIIVDAEDQGEDEDEDKDETLADDAFGMGAVSEEDEDDSGYPHKDVDSESGSGEEAIADEMPDPEDIDVDASSADDDEDLEEKSRREAFFAPEDLTSKSKATNAVSGSFQTMTLSRPILRGLAAVGFTTPTPIQAKTIPVALLGKDVVGGAVTGSGKTAAFIIPILERLLYRPKKVPTSRVAVLMPTRELAVQCFNVAKKLASFTDITFCQAVGGFSLREQEAVLRSRPDVIIATPGRFIDHMRNSASFTIDTLEILVLDEADRMLEDGFADELNEILTTIPKSRQTMLFSATMTDKVDKLIRVGLNRPVRLLVDARKQTVGTLIQEFVRLRPGREDKRLGYLLYLCQNIYTERVIVFFRKKKEVHRVRIIFGLCGIKAVEVHGDMSQEQRIASIESFRNSTTTKTTHLLATDVLSRGIDIKNVSTVINYEAPQKHETYLHRVGRTARAGRIGRACTIAAEPDRKVVKQAVRSAKAQGAKTVSRVVEPGLADEWMGKVEGLEGEVEAVLKEEKEEKELGKNERDIRRGENLIDHQEEILSRPKRDWYQSEAEKIRAKKVGWEELNGRVGGKLSGKDRKRLDAGRERGEGRMWKKKRGEGVVERGGRNKDREKGKGRGKDGKMGMGKGKGKDGGGGAGVVKKGGKPVKGKKR